MQSSVSTLKALRLRKTSLALLAVALGLSSTMRAAQADDQSSWGLGLGAMSEQKPYAGIDRETQALPIIHFENRYVRWQGPDIELKLPGIELADSQRLDFSLVGQYDGSSGYEADDADILEGMGKRRSGLWAGVKVNWHNDLADLSLQWTHDVSGDSHGQAFDFGLERTWQFGKHVMLTPRLGATWQDRKYLDYYFGVSEVEAQVNRPFYEAKSGVSTELGMRGVYMLDQQHSLFLDLEMTRLSSQAKDSPLVDRSTASSVSLGYIYRFE